MIEKCSNLKINALEKIELANKKIFELEQELEEYNDEQDSGENDMIGSIMDMAKNSNTTKR